jgi:hypothetical protein
MTFSALTGVLGGTQTVLTADAIVAKDPMGRLWSGRLISARVRQID